MAEGMKEGKSPSSGPPVGVPPSPEEKANPGQEVICTLLTGCPVKRVHISLPGWLL